MNTMLDGAKKTEPTKKCNLIWFIVSLLYIINPSILFAGVIHFILMSAYVCFKKFSRCMRKCPPETNMKIFFLNSWSQQQRGCNVCERLWLSRAVFAPLFARIVHLLFYQNQNRKSRCLHTCWHICGNLLATLSLYNCTWIIYYIQLNKACSESFWSIWLDHFVFKICHTFLGGIHNYISFRSCTSRLRNKTAMLMQ